MTRPFSLLVGLLTLTPTALRAALPPVGLLGAPFLSGSVRLDGRLNEAVWKEAAFLGPLVRADGQGMPNADTVARIFATADQLWFGVCCEEPEMARLQSSRGAHDAQIWVGDCIELFLQPKSGGEYFHFIANADGARYEERNLDSTWNADWQAAGHRDEASWSVEVAIPWKTIGGRPTVGVTWKFNLCRSRRPEMELSAWSPTGGGFHVPERFGTLRLGASTWLTDVDWGHPWLGRQQLRVRVAGRPLALYVGDSPAAEATPGEEVSVAYNVADEGIVALILSAAEGKEAVFRQAYLLRVEPLEPTFRCASDALAEARRAVSGKRLSPAVRRALRTRCDDLRADLARLRGRTSEPSISERDRDARALSLEQLAVDAGHLALCAEDASALSSSVALRELPTYSLGVASSLVKLLSVRRFSGPAADTLKINAARNEVAALQLVIVAHEQNLHGVTLAFDGPSGPKEPRLSWRRVGTVVTRKPVYEVEHVGEWPDPLMAPAPFDVEAGKRAFLWIDARVPGGASAGEHRFTLHVRPSNAPERLVPVVVRVRNFTIPKEHHLRTAFGLNPGEGANFDLWVRNYLDHRISPYSPGGEAKVTQSPAFNWTGGSALLAKVRSSTQVGLRLLLDTSSGRLAAGPLVISQANWQEVRFELPKLGKPVTAFHFALEPFGSAEVDLDDLRIEAPGGVRLVDNCDAVDRWQAAGAWSRCTAAPDPAEGKSAIRWTVKPTVLAGWLDRWPMLSRTPGREADLPLTVDFTTFDAAMQQYEPLGLDSFIVSLPSISRESSEVDAAEAVRASQPDLLAAAWQNHLKEKGWLERGYTYLFDEPEPAHYPALNRVMGSVKLAAPGLRNMMTARSFPKELKYVDIWCPEVCSFDPEACRAEQARGKEIWWYVAFSTRHPRPNFWVDYPALDCRVLFWMTWKHRLDGVLYWSGTYWAEDPWKNPMTFPGANGDGSLMYPGPKREPVDSLRWECIRDGIEDFEVFCLLEAARDALRKNRKAAKLVREADALLAVDDDVVKSYKEYSPDPSRLLAARERMDDCLERCIKALGKEPIVTKWPRFPKPLPAEPLPPVALPQPPFGASAELPPLPAAKPEPGLVARFDLDGPWPFAVDTSGTGNHGLVLEAKRCEGPGGRPALCFETDRSGVRLPGAAALLGSEPTEGTLAVWVRPDFDPAKLPTGLWEGYHVIAYLMQTDGNGLPDGWDEIGLHLHGPTLCARAGGGADCMFAAIPCPLRQGQWTHLALTFAPNRRVLYVNGKPAAARDGPYPPPKLDNFPGALGYHPSSGQWRFRGAMADVRIYNRVVGEEEIARQAKGGR